VGGLAGMMDARIEELSLLVVVIALAVWVLHASTRRRSILPLCCGGNLLGEFLKIENETRVCVFVNSVQPQMYDKLLCEKPVLRRFPSLLIFCTGGEKDVRAESGETVQVVLG
jgi:hypothetical protein